MKKTTLLYFFAFCTSFLLNAQKKLDIEQRDNKIKTLKIAFLTEKLNLTPKEAEKFWPVYNIFDEKIFQLERVEKHKIISPIIVIGGIDSISENEAKKLVFKINNLEKQLFEIKNDFDNELSAIISYKKILKLKTAEKEFIRNLMRKFKKNHR